MSWDEISDSVCPIAQSLLIVGDRWTMLILRELAMGMHRFDELQAQTGMSSHLLTLRLKRLEQDGIIERRLYKERPPRYEYHTTQMGKDLDPLLMMLRTWGRKWVGDCPEGEPAVALVHKVSGIELDDLWQIPEGGRDFTFADVEPSIGPTFAAERERRRAAFYGVTQASKAHKDDASTTTSSPANKKKTVAVKTATAGKTKATPVVSAKKTNNKAAAGAKAKPAVRAAQESVREAAPPARSKTARTGR